MGDYQTNPATGVGYSPRLTPEWVRREIYCLPGVGQGGEWTDNLVQGVGLSTFFTGDIFFTTAVVRVGDGWDFPEALLCCYH